MNLLHPGEIISKHPHIRKKWTANDIGQLLRLGFISGKKLRRGCLVDEDDVLHFFSKVKKNGYT